MEIEIARGDIWLIDLDPAVGHGQAKKRPCIVISVESFNNSPGKLAVVAPLTTTYRPLSWLVEINPPDGGLHKTSYIMCHQLRTVSHKRFSNKKLGTVNPKVFDHIAFRLRILLRL